MASFNSKTRPRSTAWTMSNIIHTTLNIDQGSTPDLDSPDSDSFSDPYSIPDTDSIPDPDTIPNPDTIPVLTSQPGTNLSGSEEIPPQVMLTLNSLGRALTNTTNMPEV